MTARLISRADIDFLLYDWLGITQLCARARYAEHSRETFDATLDTYERVAVDEFAPHNKKNDRHEPNFDGERVTVNPEVGAAVRAFFDAGLAAAALDVEIGGMQLPYALERAGMAYLYAANVGTAGYPLLTLGNVNLLLAHGSPEQVRRYVPPMLAGRFFVTMCLSEPQAGSSLSDITTRAEPQADGTYRLFGHKMWISGGDHELGDNIVHLVLAKVPDAEGRLRDGVKGISLFLVPKTLVNADGSLGERNDVTLAGLNHKMGYRGTTNCLLNFGEGKFRPHGATGALGQLVGAEGQGLTCMFHMMNEARIGVGLGAVALGYTGYLHALDYARDRVQGRLPGASGGATRPVALIQHADVRRMLLAQKSYVEGGLALLLYTSRLVDDQRTAASTAERDRAGLLLDLLTPIAKSWPSQWCLAANDLAIQVHGGYGYTRDYDVEQFYRDNRLNSIHEGTHGIQAVDLLGRKTAMREGAALAELAREIEATLARSRCDAQLGEWADAVGSMWSRLLEVTRGLHAEPDPVRKLANATPYLEAFGHVVVAWLWLEQASVARKLLAGDTLLDEAQRDFLLGKCQACRYFVTWELPKARAWLEVLEPIETACLDMRDAWY